MDPAAWDELAATARDLANPLGLTPGAWLGAIAFKTAAALLLDPVVLAGARIAGVQRLPSRVPVPIMKGLETLKIKDWTFLLVNQFIEGMFLMNFAHFAATHPAVERDMNAITLGNTVVFAFAAFLLDDAMYYWAHRFMHHPVLYPWCHKHHHRQSMPRRGYLDAANEHPVEQAIGLGLVLITWYALLHLSPFGVHAAGVGGFMAVYAILAFLNHTEYDVQIGWLWGYTVRAHEMHHRFPHCNFAQNTMLWDKLLGTFAEYRPGMAMGKRTL